MHKFFFSLLAAMLPLVVSAQNIRSAVSINGSDLNPCTTASPCRSFGTAMTATVDGGEIIAIDSAGYGPFTIDRSIVVSGASGVHAAITVISGAGITVLSGNPRNVLIRNLVLIGNGGSAGISTEHNAFVRVLGCVVRGFTTAGIDSNGPILIDRSTIIDNVGGIGVRFQNPTLLEPGRAIVTNSTIQGNSSGLVVREMMTAAVKDSLITDNVLGAGAFSATDNTTAEMTIENCTIAHNTSLGVQTDAIGSGVLARIYLSQNVIAYNPQGVSTGTNSSVVSFHNNRFVGNATDGGPFGTATFE